MKKILLLFVSTLVLSLTSCDKDDDGDSSSIEGKWSYFQEGTEVNGQEVLVNYVNDCSTKSDYVEILAGGVFKDVYYYDDCTEEVDTGSWSKDGSNITVSFNGFSSTGQILTLDNSTLKVKSTVEGEIYIQVFKRQ